jgi:UDP-glucose 4-epimerase
MQVLVTGSSGFIGRHLVRELLRRSFKVRVARREGQIESLPDKVVESVELTGPGTSAVDWQSAVADCDAIIHLAARVHSLNQYSEYSSQTLHLANVEFARACGEAAVMTGINHFIFLSSAGVHGGISSEVPFSADSPFSPHTPYTYSKVVAEQVLTNLFQGTRTALTIIRPPLVYGPGSPGVFGDLINVITRGWPLPLGMVTNNRKSIVAIDNLVDLILVCLSHPAAINQNFLVSDGEDLSTVDLLLRLGQALGRPSRMLPIPESLLKLGANLLGRQDTYQRLCGSLQLDITKTRELLDWVPPVSVDEGLRRAAEGLRQ